MEGTDLAQGEGQNGEECQLAEPHNKFQAMFPSFREGSAKPQMNVSAAPLQVNFCGAQVASVWSHNWACFRKEVLQIKFEN